MRKTFWGEHEFFLFIFFHLILTVKRPSELQRGKAPSYAFTRYYLHTNSY